MQTRKTRQKNALMQEINKFQNFFSAEELYYNVKKIDKKISLATTYRFLKQLRNDKKLFFYTCNNKLLYSNEKKSHCHFICQETGTVIHFDVDSLDFLKDKIPGTINSFQIEVKGTCNKCFIKSDKKKFLRIEQIRKNSTN